MVRKIINNKITANQVQLDNKVSVVKHFNPTRRCTKRNDDDNIPEITWFYKPQLPLYVQQFNKSVFENQLSSESSEIQVKQKRIRTIQSISSTSSTNIINAKPKRSIQKHDYKRTNRNKSAPPQISTKRNLIPKSKPKESTGSLRAATLVSLTDERSKKKVSQLNPNFDSYIENLKKEIQQSKVSNKLKSTPAKSKPPPIEIILSHKAPNEALMKQLHSEIDEMKAKSLDKFKTHVTNLKDEIADFRKGGQPKKRVEEAPLKVDKNVECWTCCANANLDDEDNKENVHQQVNVDDKNLSPIVVVESEGLKAPNSTSTCSCLESDSQDESIIISKIQEANVLIDRVKDTLATIREKNLKTQLSEVPSDIITVSSLDSLSSEPERPQTRRADDIPKADDKFRTLYNENLSESAFDFESADYLQFPLNTITERSEVSSIEISQANIPEIRAEIVPEQQISPKIRKLTVQKMPAINIPRGYVMQKTLNLTIRPDGESLNSFVEESDNVRYEAIKVKSGTSRSKLVRSTLDKEKIEEIGQELELEAYILKKLSNKSVSFYNRVSQYLKNIDEDDPMCDYDQMEGEIICKSYQVVCNSEDSISTHNPDPLTAESFEKVQQIDKELYKSYIDPDGVKKRESVHRPQNLKETVQNIRKNINLIKMDSETDRTRLVERTSDPLKLVDYGFLKSESTQCNLDMELFVDVASKDITSSLLDSESLLETEAEPTEKPDTLVLSKEPSERLSEESRKRTSSIANAVEIVQVLSAEPVEKPLDPISDDAIKSSKTSKSELSVELVIKILEDSESSQDALKKQFDIKQDLDNIRNYFDAKDESLMSSVTSDNQVVEEAEQGGEEEQDKFISMPVQIKLDQIPVMAADKTVQRKSGESKIELDVEPITLVEKIDRFSSPYTNTMEPVKMRVKKHRSSKGKTKHLKLESSLSEGEIRCQCSSSLGEFHKCANIKLERFPKIYNLGSNLNVEQHRTYFKNWMTYYVYRNERRSINDSSSEATTSGSHK